MRAISLAGGGAQQMPEADESSRYRLKSESSGWIRPLRMRWDGVSVRTDGRSDGLFGQAHAPQVFGDVRPNENIMQPDCITMQRGRAIRGAQDHDGRLLLQQPIDVPLPELTDSVLPPSARDVVPVGT